MLPMRQIILFIVALVLAAVSSERASASSAVRLPLDRLAELADRVVVAELVAKRSAWGSKHLRIFTTYRFKVNESIAGSDERVIEIVQPGGTVGRLTQHVAGYARFAEAGPMLLFLEHKGSGAGLRVVGLCQGVFGLHRVDGRQVLVQRLEGLHFPNDAGRPILLEWKTARERIRTVRLRKHP
jgi:hypothetical protein